MLLIIAVHFRGHGGWFDVTGVNAYFMQLGRALFTPSVNVFVMISAYFMCTRDDMKIYWNKLGKLWLSVFFYSIVLFTVFTATGVYKFDVMSLLASLFPVTFTKYWFVSAYFLMMIASPFLNAIVSRLNKAQFSALCLFIIIVAALQDIGLFSTIRVENGGNGIWFCLLYLLAAYIRKFDIQLNRIPWIICAVVFIGIVLFITFVWTGASHPSIVSTYMSLFILLSAKKFKITNVKLSKVICFISSLTFGIY
ncbi:MAG: acyltransferase, partial [Clostridia bacterium]|nr:acyltransferase [Clostridia bacterium]